MKNLNLINPYSDADLYWNSATDNYELKSNFVIENFGNNFTDAGVLDRRIKKNSRIVYSYIMSHSNTKNMVVVKKLINKTEEGRRFIKQALTIQMEADCENGYNDLGITPPINATNGKVIKREEIIRNKLTPDCEDFVLNLNVEYFGFNIFYAGVFPLHFFQKLGVRL